MIVGTRGPCSDEHKKRRLTRKRTIARIFSKGTFEDRRKFNGRNAATSPAVKGKIAKIATGGKGRSVRRVNAMLSKQKARNSKRRRVEQPEKMPGK